MSARARRLRSIALTAALVAGAAPLAHADTGPAAGPARSAAQLKQAGDDHMRGKRYEDALGDYDAAYAITADPVLLYNRGRALQFLARHPEALAALRRFEAEAPRAVRARVPGLAALVAEVRSRVAMVRIDCDVAGARVLIAKRQIGVTSLGDPFPVNAGKVSVEVLADGYMPFQREVELRGDEALNVIEADLTPKSTQGRLLVRSDVAGARVTIDGRAVGAAPAEASLQAGRHAVEVAAEGHDTASTQVVVGAGERREISVDPVKRPPLYARWWFWTAVGVVAAGTVVTYVVTTTEGPPPTGSFSPGVIRF
ncbi:PEGA domain-containing protein [Chondromyces apiculatus]|uniref:S-layer protein n=1 Tax=Chondromyces apiculatus DSM 436 TaxID=1192034 RepID=A0A017TIS9_9BACT|nr:PEGA domain-containing protein [Chondromyces apiculatus]EYF08807.1 S-layer protein [Chondromyces apiculatus DSM 436]